MPSVYWTEAGLTAKVRTAGGLVNTLATGIGKPAQIVVNAIDLFWSDTEFESVEDTGVGFTGMGGFSTFASAEEAAGARARQPQRVLGGRR